MYSRSFELKILFVSVFEIILYRSDLLKSFFEFIHNVNHITRNYKSNRFGNKILTVNKSTWESLTRIYFDFSPKFTIFSCFYQLPHRLLYNFAFCLPLIHRFCDNNLPKHCKLYFILCVCIVLTILFGNRFKTCVLRINCDKDHSP